MTKPVAAAHGNAQLVCAVQHGMKTSPSAAATRYVTQCWGRPHRRAGIARRAVRQ